MDSWHDDDIDGFDEEGSGDNEWKFGGKDALIFLIDCSPNMHRKFNNVNGESNNTANDDTPFKMALRCIHATLRNKILATPHDNIGVLMFGTKNRVNVRDFEGLSLLLKLGTPEGDSILKLEQLLEDTDQVIEKDYGGSSATSFAMHEAFWQCQAMFNEVSGKVASKTVLLMTCNDDPHPSDANLKRQVLKKAKDLQEMGILLDLLALSENGQFDTSKFYADILPDPSSEDGNDTGEGKYAVNSQKVEDLLRIVRKRIHKKRSNGKIEFDLGGVNMAVSLYNLVQRTTKAAKVMLARDTNEPIIRQRNYIHPHTGAPLLPSDIDIFQEYGGQKIRFTQDEVKSMMVMEMKPGLKLIRFRPLCELKFSNFVRSCNFIYPDDLRIKGSRILFSALLQRCLERSVMPICRFKPRDRTAPSLVALIPQDEIKEDSEDGTGIQVSPPGFSVFYLPFSDDKRSLPEDATFSLPDNDQVDIASQIIKKLKLKKFSIEAFENPALQAHYRLLEALALERAEVQDEADCTLPPLERQKKKLADLPQLFANAHGFKAQPQKVEKRKADPKENNGNGKNAKTDGSGNDKAIKSPVSQSQMESSVTSKSVHKFTVDQLKTFLESVGDGSKKKNKAEYVQCVYNFFGASA